MLIGEKWLSPRANRAYDILKKSSSGEKTLFRQNNKNKISITNQNTFCPSGLHLIYRRYNRCIYIHLFVYLKEPLCVRGAAPISQSKSSAHRPCRTICIHLLLQATGATSSKHYNQLCYGWNLSGTPEAVLREIDNKVQLKWLINAYRLFPHKDSFFIVPKSGDMSQSFFSKLAGNDELWRQVRDGVSEQEIRKSWQPELNKFKAIRKKYLLYKDFE